VLEAFACRNWWSGELAAAFSQCPPRVDAVSASGPFAAAGLRQGGCPDPVSDTPCSAWRR